MAFNIKDVSQMIEQQIKNYKNVVIESENGSVVKVGDGIALIYGLEGAMLGELIFFPKTKNYGMVQTLNEGSVGVVVFGEYINIIEGDKVLRTSKVVETPTGNALLGRVIDALGNPIDGAGDIKTKTFAPIEKIATGVMARKSVHQPLETGILAIDASIPIGKGQRELIIGDRQTGKTAIAIDTIINQKGKNVKCIYVSIGQKDSTIATVVEKLRKFGAMEYTTVVNASASESSVMQYIAPYTGVTIAEEWMFAGDDVLIVYDDLTKHAVAYREMSLLLRVPPGREAYPGGVFYLHSRLLERAAKLSDELNAGSITALPVVETQANDISAYIPTNIISITDGQIFLGTDLFNSGVRPAIKIGPSVSRVGSSAQIKAMKQVSGTLKLELAQYYELEAFSKFGSDLEPTTKATLEHGARIIKLLIQPQYSPMNQIDQVLILEAIKHKLIKWIPLENISDFKQIILEHFATSKTGKAIYNKLVSKQAIEDTLEESIINEISKLVYKYTKNLPEYNVESFGIIADYNSLNKNKNG